jgi:hypothetical protein
MEKQMVWMAIHYEDNSTKYFASRSRAVRFAEGIVGNNSAAQPFIGTLLYGPGDGTTSVMLSLVSRDHVPVGAQVIEGE